MVLQQDLTNTIKNGFRKCGLYHFNQEAVDYTKCVKNTQGSTLEHIPTVNTEITTVEVESTIKVVNYYRKDLEKEGVNVDVIAKILRKDEELQENITKKQENIKSQNCENTVIPISSITKETEVVRQDQEEIEFYILEDNCLLEPCSKN
ncbi:unnamed protein product [Parnassius apollo]|uniref:(apollo) hypothetical protein n=1 Tax=Parnassius apollo TaxID=110799 RepID=A0A8S3XGZ7_PARAO|nr:unnamed protein product [Parnassius apollo]